MNNERIDSARILIVDDEPANIALLERVLKRAGFSNLATTTDPLEVLDLKETFDPDIILLDLNMPKLDGFGVLKQLEPWTKSRNSQFLPVLVLTGDVSGETKNKALRVGAKDFLTKPFDPTEIVLRVKNLLEMHFLQTDLKRHNLLLEDRVRARTADIWDAIQQLEQSQRELRLAREETARRLSIAAEFRDDETPSHVERMSRYCALLARLAGWDEQDVEIIRVASQMHDIGKLGIPDSILLKPQALTSDERTIMETHAEIGHEILTDSDSELLRLAATIALTHHERFDGTGYPNRLSGDEIPLEGRMAAIADVYDALSNDHVYRNAFSFPESIRMMREGRGTHFDPELLDLFLDSMDAVLKVKERHADDHRGARLRAS